jgi:glucose-6-phosphate 1-dehydrogenase
MKRTTGFHRLYHYLAVPPGTFATVIDQIGRWGMNKGNYDASLIIEKPFGVDYESARQLNSLIHQVFTEDQIYRIDHYLGKETVQNILFFRFSNSMFEPLWNNRYIDNVQITIAEDIGIEGRGKFYETSGVIRDIIQNHGLQLLALIAMEPPLSFEADPVRDEKVKVLRSLIPLHNQSAREATVLGQYGPGMHTKDYRSEDFVQPTSLVPTYFAGCFYVDNWRWAGVPFYIRAGKRLGARTTDIVIQFKNVPTRLFGQCQDQHPGTLRLSVQPQESIELRYQVKYPNTVKRVAPVTMTFNYAEAFQEKILPPYARLILDALKSDLSLFVRQDGIEAMWRFIDPIIKAWQGHEPELPNYAPGSAGPAAAQDLLARLGKEWHTRLANQ